MPKGDKSSYTPKRRRQAQHIEEGYEKRGVAKKEAERRAYATVNKETGGGKKSGSGRGKPVKRSASRKGAKQAAVARKSASPRKATKKAVAKRKTVSKRKSTKRVAAKSQARNASPKRSHAASVRAGKKAAQTRKRGMS